MKTVFKNTIIIFILSLFLACGKTIVPTVVTKTDTTKKTEINASDSLTTKVTKIPEMEFEMKKPIPTIITGVSKDCDSVCNAKNEEIFNSLNSKVKQGKNELSLYYNKYTKTLTAYGKLQQSYDSIAKSVSKKVENNNEKTTIEVPIIVEKPLSQEQKINLWTGRSFWVLLVLFIGWRISKIFT